MSLPAMPAPPLPPTPVSSGQQLQYSLNSRVMVAATLLLCIVVFFVVSLHVYAKWFWRRARGGAAAGDAPWRPRRRHHHHLPAEFVDVLGTPAASPGLDPCAIDSLPCFVYQGKQRDAASPLLECAVCLSEFQRLETGRTLPACRHSFHIACIDAWLRSHSTCPLCRVPVSPWIPHYFDRAPPIPPSPTSSFPLLPTTAHRHEEDDATAQRDAPPCSAANHVQGHQHPQAFPPTDAQASSKLAMDGLCESSSSSKSVSACQEQGDSGASVARCQSLGVPGRSSEDAEPCALQSAKSKSFHKSIRWLMSRDLSRGKGRIFPSASGIEVVEKQDQQLEQSCSRFTGLPV